MHVKAEALALSVGKDSCDALIVYVDAKGIFDGAWATSVSAPKTTTPQFSERLEEGRRLKQRTFRP
jgi:hypothetical protein